jgi:hypothetical protein
MISIISCIQADDYAGVVRNYSILTVTLLN